MDNLTFLFVVIGAGIIYLSWPRIKAWALYPYALTKVKREKACKVSWAASNAIYDIVSGTFTDYYMEVLPFRNHMEVCFSFKHSGCQSILVILYPDRTVKVLAMTVSNEKVNVHRTAAMQLVGWLLMSGNVPSIRK